MADNIKKLIEAGRNTPGPIGVFDSGYGGLTILKSLQEALPEADFIYLGDNARAPYGNRSFELVYEFTRQAVMYLFSRGCHLVILACNTASAKALRTIQQVDLPDVAPSRRVLGVIRPTAEYVGSVTKTQKVALVATAGTVKSDSYRLELKKLFPEIKLYSKACPMWVPVVENGEMETEGAEFFISRDINEVLGRDKEIDTLILGCTHYPLLVPVLNRYVKDHVKILSQGNIVARSLVDYLRRHPEVDYRVSRRGVTEYLTTEHTGKFAKAAGIFMGKPIEVLHVDNMEHF